MSSTKNGRSRNQRSRVPQLLRFSLLQRFAVTSLAVFLVLGVALSLLLSESERRIALDEESRTAYDTLHSRLLQHIAPADLAGPMRSTRYRDFDGFIRDSILSDRTVRVKVWNSHGVVVYSNDRAILGRAFPIEQELAEALQGELASEVSDLTKSENRDERKYGKLLEVYIPIQYRPGGKVLGAFEIYQTYGPVARQISSLQRSGYLLLGGGLFVLYVLLFGIVRRGSNTIIRQQQDLLRGEERFRATFEHAAVGIAHSDLDGHWLLINQRLLDLYGYTRDELASLRFQDITHPDDLEIDLSQLNRLLRGEIERYTIEKRFIRKDGSIFWGRLNLSLVRDEADAPLYTVSVIEDITERKRAEAALEHQALHDPLTDLPNRVLLQDRLTRAILAARRNNTAVSLLLMDLDRFKEINDTFGHDYGDRVLQELGLRLGQMLRESDTIARLGGDEFAILIHDTDEYGAAQVAEKIREMVAQPFEVEGQSLEIAASIGIVHFPEHGSDASLLLQHADVAMYHAKRTDSGYAVYTSEQDQYSPDRLVLIGELRRAIEEKQLLVYYQPIVNLKTGQIDGVEALARWKHPQRGLIPPDQFIPLAEHTGLIRPLTTWVLSQALQQRRWWQGVGRDLRVSVNLSARSLHDPHLLETVMALVESWEAPLGSLQLELTETALMVDPARGAEILRQLHEIGAIIAVDDYGSGYSSLAYIRQLPLRTIKIDKSFVMEMAANGGDSFIVRSVADLGHSLGLDVIAEGVEDVQTLEMLTAMGCDFAQGYYLGRPLPASQVFSSSTMPVAGSTR